MKISIFGLGYVGAVAAGCLARAGHEIVGVDVQAGKVEEFNRGTPPIVEPGLPELFRSGRAKGLLRATMDAEEALGATDVSIVCVGTPSTVTGALDLSYVGQVLREMGEALRRQSKNHTLVIRSTLLTGSTARLVETHLGDLEKAGSLQVFYYPEFLRESTAVADFDEPSIAVVGTRDGSRPAPELMRDLFGEEAEVVDWGTAEMVKYACNAFHAVKITFANEVGRVAKAMRIDGRRVMNLLCRDTRLNLSPYYMKPGNPFGGSCLPKDVRALTHQARVLGLSVGMIESVLPSNERHLQSLLGLILDSGQTEVAILGLSFKSDTDDLRESAMVEVAQALLGRGYTVRIYDPALNLAALVGSNKRVIDLRMPHLASLLRSNLREAVGGAGLVVAAQKVAAVGDLASCLTSKHRVLDVNGWPELKSLPVPYEGFCW